MRANTLLLVFTLGASTTSSYELQNKVHLYVRDIDKIPSLPSGDSDIYRLVARASGKGGGRQSSGSCPSKSNGKQTNSGDLGISRTPISRRRSAFHRPAPARLEQHAGPVRPVARRARPPANLAQQMYLAAQERAAQQARPATQGRSQHGANRPMAPMAPQLHAAQRPGPVAQGRSQHGANTPQALQDTAAQQSGPVVAQGQPQRAANRPQGLQGTIAQQPQPAAQGTRQQSRPQPLTTANPSSAVQVHTYGYIDDQPTNPRFPYRVVSTNNDPRRRVSDKSHSKAP